MNQVRFSLYGPLWRPVHYIIYIALIATSRVSLITSFQPPLIQKNNNVTGHVSQEISTANRSEPKGSKVTSSMVTGGDMCKVCTASNENLGSG